MTANCDRWTDSIAEAAAGAPTTPGLEAHLEACDPCRQALHAGEALHARIDGELRQALAESPSPRLLPLVREQLSKPGASWMPFLVPAAAALALVVFSISEWRRPAGSSQPVRTVAARSAAPAGVETPAVDPQVSRAVAAPATRRRAPRTAAGSPYSPASLMADDEPIVPSALVIAPLDASPPIELKPLVTVGLDTEGAER